MLRTQGMVRGLYRKQRSGNPDLHRGYKVRNWGKLAIGGIALYFLAYKYQGWPQDILRW